MRELRLVLKKIRQPDSGVLNIMRGRRHRGTLCALLIAGAWLGAPAENPAPAAQAPDPREERSSEFLYKYFGAAGRRANPSEQEIDWRTRAGDHELAAWPSEVELRGIETVLGEFFGALQGRGFDPTLVESVLADDFRGTELVAADEPQRETGGLDWTRWRIADRPGLDRQAFAANWQSRYRQFDLIVRTEHHVDRFDDLGEEAGRRLDIVFRVTGYRDDAGYEDQGEMQVEFSRTGADRHWQMRRLRLLRLETLEAPRLFSPEALVPEAPPVDTPLTAFVDYFAQGLSVVDIDGDGDTDVFAPTRFSSPRVFLNAGARRFTEAGDALGFGKVLGARSAYFFDFDNDGDQDALVLTAARLHLFEQRDGRFVDVSAASGFDRISTTGLTGATVADFDNDGLLDFYVANYGDLAASPVMDYFDSRRGFKNQLFRNTGGGRFAMITRPAGLDLDNGRWTFAALAFDYDRDGWQDLYVVNDYGPNQLFRNRGDLTFEDVTESAGVTDFGNGMGVSLGDLDNDGVEDLYVSNMISHAGKRMAGSADFPGEESDRERLARFAKGNTLLLGAGDGGFREVETPELSDAKWAWGNVLFDYDNDGDLDVYVANGMYTNLMRKDVDPVFWRHLLAPISTRKPPGDYATGYFAYLIQQESRSFAGNERNRLFQNFGEARYRDVAAPVGADLVFDSRGVAAADLDNDGDLDLVVSNRNGPGVVILWNETASPGQHLAVRLAGHRSNRDGVGARIDLACGSRRQVRSHLIGSGYVSQGPHAIWFGLGECEEPRRISVRWPSGLESSIEAPAAGSSIVIEEPAAIPPMGG